jgi:hypothetical protein
VDFEHIGGGADGDDPVLLDGDGAVFDDAAVAVMVTT